MEEMFKIIPSFPDYLVSNFGRVKTLSRKIRYVHPVTKKEHFRDSAERFLKVQFNKLTGYKFHQLYKDKKMYNRPIHCLVAESFIGEKPDGMVINHKDGNKHNNVVENLEYCTNSYNHYHATKTGLKTKGVGIGSSKLNERCVYAIKWMLKIGLSHSEISKAFKISRPSISLISEGKTWNHVQLTCEELNIHL